MKISASFGELRQIEFMVYKIPTDIVKQLIEDKKNYSWQIKMTKRFNIKDPTSDNEVSMAKYLNTRRHQIVVTTKAANYMQPEYNQTTNKVEAVEKSLIDIKLYSKKLTTQEVKDLGLEPIEKATKEEELALMLYKIGEKV